MTNEEAILREADAILAAAHKEEARQVDESVKDALVRAEQAAWESKPLTEDTYDVWAFTKKYSGTPEGLREFRKHAEANDPTVKSVEGSAWHGGTANACICLEHLLTAVPDETPETVKAVLFAPAFVIKLHTTDHFDGAPLEGLFVRSQAWASQQLDKRPSDADDRADVVVCVGILRDTMMKFTRDAKTGEPFGAGKPEFVKVVRHDGTNHDEVKECFHDLGETHGDLAQGLYGAVYMPKAMRGEDPELWDAMVTDFLAQEAEEDNNPNEQGDKS